ncbi:hypothetical protein [Neobacillus niacini]|uniref:hypothetical protein n=1 Tax=Neobacillus niacini TaxID=86668 RepID=UPI003982DA89
MKKVYILMISFVLIIGAVLVYFFLPLSNEQVFPEIKNIQTIYLGPSRNTDGEIDNANISLVDSKTLSGFSRVFEDVEYSRILKQDINNFYRFYTFTIIYMNQSGEVNNFEIQINENGYITVLDQGRKHYKITKSNGEKVFREIEHLLMDSNVEISNIFSNEADEPIPKNLVRFSHVINQSIL